MTDRRVRYTVKTFCHDFQPTPYSDHVSRFLILVERPRTRRDGTIVWETWQQPQAPADVIRPWALRLVRTLCMDFREKGDDDGRTGLDAALYPHLKDLDVKDGIIEVEIRRVYTD